MSRNDTRRDEVLFAFHEAHERPTPEEVMKWTRQHPEFAEDIIAHAEHLLSLDALKEFRDDQPDEAAVERNWSWTLNAMFEAEKAGSSTPAAAPSGETFAQLLEKSGLTIPALARLIDIDRLVLGELNAGRLRPPINARLLDALSKAFHRARNELDQIIERTIATPKLGNAKASNKPEVYAQSYESVILSSDMSAEKKNYWLGRDSSWTPGGISG